MCSLENSAWSVYSRYTSWPLLKITHRPFSSRDVKKLASLTVSLSESLQVSLRCSHGQLVPLSLELLPFYRGKARNANKKTPLKPGCVTQSRRCFSRNPFYDVLYTSYFVLCYWRAVIQVYICLIVRKGKRKKGRKKKKRKKKS